ncbi:hypothetical protein P3X46_010876 [Hevea brasiliensis]|uniref:Uncharacterized protein n=1 Tax=Hevea brasiliensis TaxID=3981 RepID=A0ABQ9MHW2_HEVBR|nr:hypothetical protein P3X46_010876 [Hevea brasiliensis]
MQIAALTVKKTTSCSSTRYTRDHISLAFGDAYGNQTCYLYLYRSGYDGWKPKTVTIYGYNTRSITFTYNTFISNGVWYGFSDCNGAFSAFICEHYRPACVILFWGFVL